MIKELRTYDTIVGLSDFDEYSYCEKDQMWYEDAKEVLPQPEKESEVVSDLICEIKVNHDASIWDEAEDWNKLEEDKDGLRLFAEFLFGDNFGWDCTDNAFLLKTPNQVFIAGLNDYGLWEVESFTKKLKNQAYATEYSEYGGVLKFIAWTNEDNQTRFVIHSYNEKVVMILCLGGNTNAIVSPYILKLLNELSVPTFVICTFPFSYEPNKKKTLALSCLTEINKLNDNRYFLRNDDLLDLNSHYTLEQMFGFQNEEIARKINERN